MRSFLAFYGLAFSYNFDCDSAGQGVLCVESCNVIFDECVDDGDDFFECFNDNLACIDDCPCYDNCFNGCTQCPEHEFCYDYETEEAKACHSSCVISMLNCLETCDEPRVDCHYKCNSESFHCTRKCPCMDQ